MIETANDTNKDIDGLLRFDLSSIPPAASWQSATLKLTVEGGQGTNRQIEIHELLTSFTEGTGTSGGTVCTSAGNGASWGDTDGADAGRGGPNCTDSWTPVDSFTSSNYGATNYGTIDPLVDETTYSVDVKMLVQGWLTTPSSNIGIAMIPAGIWYECCELALQRVCYCHEAAEAGGQVPGATNRRLHDQHRWPGHLQRQRQYAQVQPVQRHDQRLGNGN